MALIVGPSFTPLVTPSYNEVAGGFDTPVRTTGISGWPGHNPRGPRTNGSFDPNYHCR